MRSRRSLLAAGGLRRGRRGDRHAAGAPPHPRPPSRPTTDAGRLAGAPSRAEIAPGPRRRPPRPRTRPGGAGDEVPARVAGAAHRQWRADHAARGAGAGVHLDPRGAALRRRRGPTCCGSAGGRSPSRVGAALGLAPVRRPAARRGAGRAGRPPGPGNAGADRGHRGARPVGAAPDLFGWPANLR